MSRPITETSPTPRTVYTPKSEGASIGRTRSRLRRRHEAGHDTGRHTHVRAQLVHAEQGVMTVRTDGGAWVVPPGYAVWVPAGVPHGVTATSPVAMRTLYLREDCGVPIPADCRVVGVPDLVRELIARVVSLPQTIRAMDRKSPWPCSRTNSPNCQPRSTSASVRSKSPTIADHLIRTHPIRALSEWGDLVGASDRTLARLFEQETNMRLRPAANGVC